ncbi:hypothetical protein TPHA_0A01410 [Tetrapisispora phaffii CBS 4417]|uniref:Exocyst complex component SEC5 n=1 Tax=Tetrapisispora phaffii (strain ATCC 24235 / CBS 4417 / NBRC 1672 / NRRL Y-8282 / UCD 70-5) TaxID=1071381 RepID=G8BMU6_TETPH|nr:hypothetical protein TPHA_0A01410 [Tetrapisispora phaffii CBS 4417]CCE61224.1 hypothetical protein TPHA_0A01410 [Tetrapisispora phaffii CBS 4417]
MSNPFDITENQLLDFYELNSLDPKDSWLSNSTKTTDLSKWQNVSDFQDESYEILKDLMNQKILDNNNPSNNSQINNDIVADPLNNKKMLEVLNMNKIPLEMQSNFLINNKKFDVIKFLKVIHDKDSFEDLSQSLDNLDNNLKNQSKELRMLIQDNFTKYVKVKNRVDQIYENFSSQDRSNSRNSIDIEALNGKLDDAVKATNQRLKPLYESANKIANYEKAKTFFEENKLYINSPKLLRTYLEKKEYRSLMVEYLNALNNYNELKVSYEKHNIKLPTIITRIHLENEKLIESYRCHIWEDLLNLENDVTQEQFLQLISKLLDLDCNQGNPILKWISKRLDSFITQFEELSVEFRGKIINSGKAILSNFKDSSEDAVDLSHYLSVETISNDYSSSFKETSEDINHNNSMSNNRNVNELVTSDKKFNENRKLGVLPIEFLTDSSIIIEMWLLILRYIDLIEKCSRQFIEFWDHVEKFMDGSYKSILLNDKKKENILGNMDTIDNYMNHLTIDEQHVREVRLRGQNMIELISLKIADIFESTQATLLLENINQKSDKDNQATEKSTGDFGFVPPYANCLSCLRYLPRIVGPILRFSTELAQLGISSHSVEILKELTTVVLTRTVDAISATKLRDISNFYKLEDWQVYQTVPLDVETKKSVEYGITQFPEIVRIFQELSIRTIRDILFSFEKLPVFNGISIVSYPSKKLLANVEMQQIVSLESVLEAILKNAAKDKDNPRNFHTILTLTNLQYIREVTFTHTLQYFDEAFEWNLKSKNLELFNLLVKMEQSIFGNYLSDLKINLRDILEMKFREISWATFTSNSFRVSDYIIEGLMVLVTVHSECFRMGPQLINKILKETQIFISKYLFESFKPLIGNISSDGLLQITVDLQFFQSVLTDLLENDTKVTLTACLQNCFQNNTTKMKKCIQETTPIVEANLTRTSTQFAAFK